MKYLFSQQKEIEKRLRGASFILLVCDFDGTLVGIKPTPQLVHLPPETKKLLALLSENSKYRLGIISGRPLREVKKIVGLTNIFYAGNHGFEIKLAKRKKFIHPIARKTRILIKKLAGEFKASLSSYKGILVEDKTYTLSIHYRRCTARQTTSLKREARRIYLPLVGEKRIKVTEGKKVIEIRPPVKWDKGQALVWIKRKLKSDEDLTIYIGDDKTDEDAFGKMKSGLSIYVGRNKKYSKAKFYLSGPPQVVDFLRLLTHL